MAINGPIKSLLGKGHLDHINLPKDMSLLIMVFEADPHAILSICRSKKTCSPEYVHHYYLQLILHTN